MEARAIMRSIIFIICLLLTLPANADKPAPSSAKTINQAMTAIANVMTDIYPLIVAKRSLSEKDQTILTDGLTQLIVLFTEARPHIAKKSETYQISYQFLLPYLEKTKRALANENLDYARSRLHAMGTICASCHTQDTHLRTLFTGISRDRFVEDYSFAEFNYVTRNYTLAETYFDKHLRSNEAKTELEIIRPLQRLITYYAQILNQPSEGAKKLSQYTSLKDHTPTTKKHLLAWIGALETLDSTGVDKLSDINFTTLKNYVEQYLGPLNQSHVAMHPTPQEEVSRVWLRGQLYHYLNNNPAKSEVPQVLYWLARCDRSIGYNFFFSLADIYLKDCIINHSDHPYAKRCFNEYEEYVSYAYSGSGGTFIPQEVQNELDELRKAIK